MSMLGIAGFLLMIVIVALLLWGKSAPATVFILVPILVGFLVGFTPSEMSGYIATGVSSVATTAILFIFAVMFFGIMNDVGVFDRIVSGVLKIVGHNILLLMFATVLIAIVGHLDGSGATTLPICIPPLLPIYKKMNVRPIVLLSLTTLAMGVMNIVPWGGPCGRTSRRSELAGDGEKRTGPDHLVFFRAVRAFLKEALIYSILPAGGGENRIKSAIKQAKPNDSRSSFD